MQDMGAIHELPFLDSDAFGSDRCVAGGFVNHPGCLSLTSN
ncbi:hypothetical protein THTE_3137 [Thermogutta terrifontis]|uniref:Uncharacterized protein n=1 Tax=Thermogutta terrifontis TaxID=1331910 RepID=A0A286RIF3_9BACT|nr:hypothetical protein THTE_3137 [Thermogutta terrifontis]